MEALLNDVRDYIESENHRMAEKKLKRIVARSSEFKIDVCGYFDELLHHKENSILKVTANAVADLCKDPDNRPAFTLREVIKPLLSMLSNKDNAVVMQAMRAIGNICFENYDAKKLIGEDGLKLLINILNKELDKDEYDYKVFHVGCGAIMNLVMVNQDYLEACIEANVADTFQHILEYNLIHFEATEMNTSHMVFILNMMSEYLINEWLPFPTIEVLVDVLKISMNPEISCMCLEILKIQSENDKIKLCMAHKGTCELVYDLVERYGSEVDNESCKSVLTMACDLIVMILTGDEPMQLLYKNGNGNVYQEMVCWLNSEDTELLTTAVLAMGNFARKDSHCIQMVNDGMGRKLLELIKKYTGDDDATVQHAILSTLRNLSVPAENKSKLLDENLVEILLSLSNIKHHLVEFKLLGTLRMVVDGQEKTAAQLIERTDFVGKLVNWCNSEHLGVRDEAPRLFAWLIKNCHSPNSYPSVLLIPKSVKCLVEMMCTMHPVMQNEALLALNLLCTSCLAGATSLDVMLMDADICANISSMLLKYGESLQVETVSNIMTFLDQLASNKMLRDAIRKSSVLDSLSKLLLCNAHIESVSERVTSFIEQYHPVSSKCP